MFKKSSGFKILIHHSTDTLFNVQFCLIVQKPYSAVKNFIWYSQLYSTFQKVLSIQNFHPCSKLSHIHIHRWLYESQVSFQPLYWLFFMFLYQFFQRNQHLSSFILSTPCNTVSWKENPFQLELPVGALFFEFIALLWAVAQVRI